MASKTLKERLPILNAFITRAEGTFLHFILNECFLNHLMLNGNLLKSIFLQRTQKIIHQQLHTPSY
jgi:hypothetical protein